MRVAEYVQAFLMFVAFCIFGMMCFAVLERSPWHSEADIATEQHLTYCEMVRLHKADPTIGWPDYKQIYDKECDE